MSFEKASKYAYVQKGSNTHLSNYIQGALTIHIAVVTVRTIGQTFTPRAKWLRFIRQGIVRTSFGIAIV